MSPSTRPKSTRTAQLAERIRGYILEQGLAENAFFMTEGQIAQTFTASRSITREAVNQLKALGVLRTRRRTGLLVGRANPVGLFSSSVAFFGRSEENFWELARFRYVLELGAVDMAVGHITDEQIQRLAELAEELASCYDAGLPEWDRVCRLEHAFHWTILQATGSPLISGLHQVLLDFFQASAVFIERESDPRKLQSDAWEHRALARAFAQRDTELVRSLMRQHLRTVLERAPRGLAPEAQPPALAVGA